MQQDPRVIDRWQGQNQGVTTTCVIVQAELLFMAFRSERVEPNLRLVRAFLDGIRILGIDGGVAESYGRLKAALLHHYGPRERGRQRRATIESLGFQENDLWIAAIAHRFGQTLVTQDRDFARIAQ